MRSQYERNGITFNDAAKVAANDVQSAVQSSGGLITNLADTSTDAARKRGGGAILNANGEIAKTTRTPAKRSV